MKFPLHIKIVIGLVLGAIWALGSAALGGSSFTIDWIKPFGDIFIRLLKFIAVPLVLFSILTGIGGVSDMGRMGRLGAKTLVAYLATTVLAVTVGLVLANALYPGGSISEESRLANRVNYEIWAAENNVAPPDGEWMSNRPEHAGLLDSLLAQGPVDYSASGLDLDQAMANFAKQKDKGPLSFLVDMVPDNIFGALAEPAMLQVIFFAIFMGIIMVMLPYEQVKPLRSLINSLNEVFLQMVHIIMKAAPVFVFALMAGQIARVTGDSLDKTVDLFGGMLGYCLTVILGLFLLGFVMYGGIIGLFVRNRSIRGFFKAIRPAQLLAFSTSSSAATLPVTMDCVRDNLGVSKHVTSFVLPVGATVNMDGTSLYQAIAVIFLAQMHMIDLTIAQQLTIVLTATLASIGAAAVPSAGLIMLIVVLTSVDLNPAWIALIFPVDRILDMCRTVVNVTGDSTVATLVAQSEGELKAKVG